MQKSGHKDVVSSIRLCRSIIEDANSILTSLPEGEAEIPTWWTNKLAICYAYMNSLRDYVVYEGIEVESENETESEDSESEDESETENNSESEDDSETEDNNESEVEDYMMPPSMRFVLNAT